VEEDDDIVAVRGGFGEGRLEDVVMDEGRLAGPGRDFPPRVCEGAPSRSRASGHDEPGILAQKWAGAKEVLAE